MTLSERFLCTIPQASNPSNTTPALLLLFDLTPLMSSLCSVDGFSSGFSGLSIYYTFIGFHSLLFLSLRLFFLMLCIFTSVGVSLCPLYHMHISVCCSLSDCVMASQLSSCLHLSMSSGGNPYPPGKKLGAGNGNAKWRNLP